MLAQLLADIKKHLHADANAQIWQAALQRFQQRIDQALRMQLRHAGPECADARQDDFAGASQIFRPPRQPQLPRFEIAQGVQDAAQVAGAIINHSQHG